MKPTWEHMTTAQRERWRELYQDILGKGYHWETAHREAYIGLWREIEAA